MAAAKTSPACIGRWQRSPRRNSLEPLALSEMFTALPPVGFSTWHTADGAPGFTAALNILTTAPELRARLQRLPGLRKLASLLTLNTAFVGSTVTEFATLPVCQPAVAMLAHALKKEMGATHSLLVIKDLPCASPILSEEDAAWSAEFTTACLAAGFAIVQGMALAYVPIDFTSIDEYLSRLSASRRKNIRRKLRSREAIKVTHRQTGDAYYRDADICDRYYTMYMSVFHQSEVKFDLLSRPFFDRLLTTPVPGSVVLEYWHDDRLAGFNICYVHNAKLIDKYIGFDYSMARELNIYFVSWIVNLEYAMAHHCTHYVAGWTDPAVKASLGARFTPTHHAIYSRHLLLRLILKRLSRVFEMDHKWNSAQA